MNLASNKKKAVNAISFGIALNILLAAGKFTAGIIGNSAALISDAVDSASDILSNFIAMAGIKMSSKDCDLEHQYGHERLECVASIIMSAMIALAGIGIGLASLQKVLNYANQEIVPPSALTLIVALSAIIAKEGMYRYVKRVALQVNSGALMADALHHRNDALSSVGSLVGILGARLGFPILDPLAGIIICVTIIKNAYEVFKNAVDQMIDRSCDEATIKQMEAIISAQPGVEHIDKIQTRIFGSRIFVDVEVSADDNLTLLEAHNIAEAIHNDIEENFPAVKHCMVHINPISETEHSY